MKSPIFAQVNDHLREELKFNDSGIKDMERRMIDIVLAHKEALIAAWVAETGLKPSESVICSGVTNDGMWRIFVESKEENEKRAKVVLFKDEVYDFQRKG